MTMRKFILSIAMSALVIPMTYAQDDFDDIYYNPSANKNKTNTKKAGKKQSNYIANFSEMDVDTYNSRGFYYETPIDTIGSATENGEDFVYTQQVQKYYNPTIVIDNAAILEDVLENSYGNVDIQIRGGYPVFSSIYYDYYAWAPSYYWWSYPSWRFGYVNGPFSWGWNVGPVWGYGPSWSWTWGPSWGWSYPHHHHHWGYPGHINRPHTHYAYNRPGATRPVTPNSGWSHNTRPGGNYGSSSARPGSNVGHNTGGGRYGVTTGNNSGRGNRNTNMGRGRNGGNGTTSVTNRNNRVNRTETSKATTSTYKSNNTTTNYNSNRSYNNNSNGSSNRSYNSTTNSNRSYNTGTNRSSGGSSYRSGSGSSGRSSGGGSHGGGRGGRR